MCVAVDRGIIRHADDGSDREVALMRETDVDAVQPDGFGAELRQAVEVDERLSAPVRKDLDLTPTKAARTGAERLHHRLFAGEAGGKFGHAAAAEGDFFGRKDARKKALRMPQEHLLHARDHNNVDADRKFHLYISVPNYGEIVA